MDGLWNFPGAFGSSPDEAAARLQTRLHSLTSGKLKWGNRCGLPLPVGRLRHGITYRSIVVDIYTAELSEKVPNDPLRWFTLSRLPRSAVSSLTRKITHLITALSRKRARAVVN